MIRTLTLLEPGIEITVNPHEVYFIIVAKEEGYKEPTLLEVLREQGRSVETPIKIRVIRTKYVYDQRTGWAHHPTDSKRSFKVK